MMKIMHHLNATIAMEVDLWPSRLPALGTLGPTFLPVEAARDEPNTARCLSFFGTAVSISKEEKHL